MGLILAVGRFHKPWVSQAHVPQQEKPLQWEARAPQLEMSPRSAAEKAAKTQRSQKQTNLNLKIIFKTCAIMNQLLFLKQ